MSLLTRKVERTRTVPFTPYEGAPTELVDETYTVDVPRDWDRAVLATVATGTGLLLTLAVTWSTDSIGALLALSGVWTAVAYGVAAVFDLAWIICMALEWLARYDPRKVKAPRIAGFVALAISMAAIAANGIRAGGKTGIAVGIIGALVSLIAKGVWTLAIRHTAKPLSPVAEQYVARRQAAAGAELAMAIVDRQLERSRAHINAYRKAYGTEPAAQAEIEDHARAASYARVLLPDADDDQIRAQLAAAGLSEVVTSPVMSPVTSSPQDGHRPDRRMTTVSAAQPVRSVVTVPVAGAAEMTGAQQLAVARQLDRWARKQKPSRPVTIGEIQSRLGLSRREATDLRKAVVGKGE